VLSTEEMWPKLTKPDHYTVPSIDEMKTMTIGQLKRIKNFTIGHKKFGKVTFPNEIDIRGIDLDKIVTIEWKAIQIYENDDPNKPPIGKGLNQYSQIELYKVFPKSPPNADVTWKPTREAMQELSLKLIDMCSKEDAVIFDSFDLDRGIWKFHVKHWTIYGLSDNQNGDIQQITLLHLPSLQTF